MKKNQIIERMFLALLMLIGLISCQDREIITVENQSAPIVVDLSTSNLFLDGKFPDNPALNVSWEAAKYTVPTEVNYKIEASGDMAFTKPYTLGSVAGSQRTVTYTASQMNAAAEAIGLTPRVPGKMYIRVTSYLGESQLVPATSNVTALTISPYELEYPTFYLVGAASPIGWNAVEALALEKNKEFSTVVTTLKSGESFRFLGQQNWSPLNYSIDLDGTRPEYRYFKQVSSNIVQDGDENMKFTGPTGKYKVTINAKVKSLSIEAQ